MDKDILRYYKKQHRGGRSGAARAVDSVVLGVVFALASYLWFRSNVPNQLVSAALAVVTTGLFLLASGLWRGISFDRFVAREKGRLRDEALLERLLLLSEPEFDRVIKGVVSALPQEREGQLVLSLRQAEPVKEDTVLRLYRQARQSGAREVLVFSTAPCSKEAGALLRRLPIPMVLESRESFIALLKEEPVMAVTEEQIDERIRSILKKHDRGALQAQPFAPGRSGRYMLCALLLFAASFITGYPLYYRLLAALCGLLAAAAFWLNPLRSSGRDHTAQF